MWSKFDLRISFGGVEEGVKEKEMRRREHGKGKWGKK